MKYICGRCKRDVEFDPSTIGIQCSSCGGKVFYKKRPAVARHVKSK